MPAIFASLFLFDDVESSVRLEATLPRAPVSEERSDDEGRYAFYKLRPGTYRLAAKSLTAPLHVRDDLHVLDGQHAKADLVIPPLTEALVHVTSTEGRPVAKARVTLLTEEGRVVRTGITGAEGLVRIPGVRQGPHVLQIRAAGFALLEEDLHVSTSEPRFELHRTLRR